MSCTVIDWDLVENTFIAKNTEKQECIPVGCVQSAAVAAEGVYPSMHWAGGMYPSMYWAGVCVSQHVLGRGVCISQHALGMGCLCPGGVCQRGVSARVGMSACRGGCLPQCMLGYTPLCGQNDRRL